MNTSMPTFVERHPLGFALAACLAFYAAWIASLVVPEVFRNVVLEVTRSVLGK
jgi:hypothetical protein